MTAQEEVNADLARSKQAFGTEFAWRDLCVAGLTDNIDRFLNELDIKSAQSWQRDKASEQRALPRFGNLAETRCYKRDFHGSVVDLWLLRRSELRVDTGIVDVARPWPTDPQALVAEAISAFRTECLEPAVAEVGLKLGHHQLGPHSLVPNWIIDALWSLYEVSAFQWPPTGKALEQWREFVITVYQNSAAFDPRELKRWLTEKGWSERAADQLIAQKDADATLLGKYDDVRQSA
jgi:hypothetical protein